MGDAKSNSFDAKHPLAGADYFPDGHDLSFKAFVKHKLLTFSLLDEESLGKEFEKEHKDFLFHMLRAYFSYRKMLMSCSRVFAINEGQITPKIEAEGEKFSSDSSDE